MVAAKTSQIFLFFGKNSIKRDEPRRTLCAFLTYCPHVKWRPWTLTATLPLQAVATKAKESRRCQETICLGKILDLNRRGDSTWASMVLIDSTLIVGWRSIVLKNSRISFRMKISHRPVSISLADSHTVFRYVLTLRNQSRHS